MPSELRRHPLFAKTFLRPSFHLHIESTAVLRNSAELATVSEAVPRHLLLPQNSVRRYSKVAVGLGYLSASSRQLLYRPLSVQVHMFYLPVRMREIVARGTDGVVRISVSNRYAITSTQIGRAHV